MTWASFRRHDVAFTQGEPREFAWANRFRAFCAQCGTPLTFRAEPESDEIDVTVCSLDNPNAVLPGDHTWTEDRLNWIHPDSLPAHQRTRSSRETVMSIAQAKELRAVAERWMKEIWRKRNLALFDEMHAPNFVDKSSAGRAWDRESYRQSIVALFAAFPDWEAIMDDLVVDVTTSKVAVRWTATGTHRAEFFGVAPTDKRITFRGIEIVRIEGKQIAERWGEWNGIELLQQLGAS